MSKCLQVHAKESDITAKEYKEAIKDNLLDELTIRDFDNVSEKGTCDFNLNVMVYDLCGYMVKTIRKHLTACEACKNLVRCNELDLPKDFTADQYTAMRNHGYLSLRYREDPYHDRFSAIKNGKVQGCRSRHGD
jgi:hypothetical protein